MRMLDDVYGEDHDRFPLEQEARWRISRLEWDDESGEEADEVWACADEKREIPAFLRRQ